MDTPVDVGPTAPTGAALPSVRREKIVAFIESSQQAGIQEIAIEFGVSSDTIRRDLSELDREGLITRTRGGAVANSAMNEPDRELRIRRQLKEPEKRRIGALAATLIHDGAVVAINGGTTALAVARSLTHHHNLTVATNNLSVPFEIPQTAVSNLYVFGGDVRFAAQVTVSNTGFPEIGTPGSVYFDIAVIGVGGITEHGFSVSNLGEASMMRHLTERSGRVLVVADETKYNRTQFALVAPLTTAHDLVVDAAPPTELATALSESGVTLHLA